MIKLKRVIVIDDYSENWSQLVYVFIVGKAKIIEPSKMSVEQRLRLLRCD